MSAVAGNLFSGLPVGRLPEELFEDIVSRPGLRIERIVSTGQAGTDWYDQAHGEWVILLAGSAGLEIEGEAAIRTLAPGDWINLPPHCRHRVAWTDGEEVTVWLAVHYR